MAVFQGRVTCLHNSISECFLTEKPLAWQELSGNACVNQGTDSSPDRMGSQVLRSDLSICFQKAIHAPIRMLCARGVLLRAKGPLPNESGSRKHRL